MKDFRPSIEIAILLIFSAAICATGQQSPTPVSGPVAAHAPHLFLDDAVSFGYGPSYETPFVFATNSPHAAKIPRTTLEFRHIDAWRFGDNFADISLRKSGSIEPAAGGGTGALEPYAILRSSISVNKLTHSRTMAFGPLRDLGFEFGANLETKNSSFSPEERTIYIGPVLQMNVPRGFLNLGLHFRKEWNHEAILGKDENYTPDFNFESTWALPFTLHHTALTFEGFSDINTPKGNDSFGSPTHTEFITRPVLWLDLASLTHKTPRVFEAGIGFEYWNNEYGKSAQTVPGATELTPLFQFRIHLPGSGPRH